MSIATDGQVSETRRPMIPVPMRVFSQEQYRGGQKAGVGGQSFLVGWQHGISCLGQWSSDSDDSRLRTKAIRLQRIYYTTEWGDPSLAAGILIYRQIVSMFSILVLPIAADS